MVKMVNFMCILPEIQTEDIMINTTFSLSSEVARKFLI